MYVRTELVHTYIAKRPSFLLSRILAVPKVGTATSIARIGTESVKSMGLLQNSTDEKNEIDFPKRGCLSHFLL